MAEDSAVNAVVRKDVYGFIVLDSNTIANKSVRYEGRNANSISDVQNLMNVVKQQVLAQRLEQAGMDPSKVNALTEEKLDESREDQQQAVTDGRWFWRIPPSPTSSPS